LKIGFVFYNRLLAIEILVLFYFGKVNVQTKFNTQKQIVERILTDYGKNEHKQKT